MFIAYRDRQTYRAKNITSKFFGGGNNRVTRQHGRCKAIGLLLELVDCTARREIYFF